jgi:DNA polymerase-3 subunit beta
MTATATKSRKSQTQQHGTELNVGELLHCIQAVGHAVHDRSPTPAMRCVLINSGSVVATNGCVRIQSRTSVGGTMLVPHARLDAILKTCDPKGSISLTATGKSCVIESSGCKWVLPTESADSFPTWKIGKPIPIARIPADQFRSMVRAVAYAADDAPGRYDISGVCVDFTDGVVSFVATDGRRLSKVEAEVDQDLDNTSVIVPAESMAIMGKLADGDGAVQLESTGKEIICTIDDGPTITSSLLNGAFPDWRKAIPDRQDAVPYVVQRDSLSSAVRAAKVCHDDTSKGVTFTFSANGIVLKSQSHEKGEATVECDIVSPGGNVSVKLDPAFVLEFLQSLPADGDPEIEVEAVTHDTAVVMRSDDFLGLVMPLTD